MRILYFLQNISPSFGGGEALFYNITKSMLKKGHEVSIICYELKSPKDNTLRRPGLDMRDLAEDGAEIYPIKPAIEDKGGVLFSYKQQLGYVLNALRKGHQIIRIRNIEILHANTYSPVIPAFILGKMLKIPVISTVHHVSIREWKLWSSQQGVQRSTAFIGPLYEKLTLKMPVQMVHVVSNSTREDLIKINPKAKAITIYNGIRIMNNIDLSDSYEYQDFVLYIGRLAITKNLGVVIDAFKSVAQSIPKAKLVIVGDGPMRKQWEQLARKNNLENKVVFMGNVSQGTKEELLRSCTALVLPSRLEGFGRVIIEAFAMCKPVLVSNIKAITEVVDNGIDGFVVSPYNVESWSEKLKFLLSNKKECTIMGRNGRKKAELKFNQTLISDQVEDLYKNVISSKY